MIRFEVSYRGIILIGLGIITLWTLTQLWPVVILVIASMVIMMGLLPYVEAMVARGIPRGGAVLLMLIAFLAITISLASVVVPALIRESQDLRDNLPDSGHQIDLLLDKFDIHSNFEERAREVDWDELISGRAAVSAGQRVLTVTVSVITVVAMTAYLLMEMPNLARFLYQFIPEDKEREYDMLFQEITRVVGGYLRGQFITSLTIGIYTFVILRIVGVANPLAFAVLAAFADVVPLVGAVIATVPPVAAALQDSATKALVVLAALMAYQQFEDRFFVPRVYGRTLNLPPIIVLIAVLAGAELLGITGVLLALPLTAAGRVWLDYMLRQRGVSLSPLEPSEDADSSDQPFAPDSEERPEDDEHRGPSLIALAGRRPREAPDQDDEGAPQAGPDQPR